MITKRDVEAAYEAIRNHVVHTPLVYSHTLSELSGCEALFKLENFQMTGSFKDRGAFNRLLRLSEREKHRGVVAASAGNHAQGVAYNCQRLGIPAKIVMPMGTPLIKVVSTQSYGAECVLSGASYDDACERALEIAAEEDRLFIHPFDDPWVIAGQGTIAVEVLQHELCKELDAVLCPIGGGGLISGIATYVKETRPSVAVIGVEPAACPSMKESLEQGRHVELQTAGSLADGLVVKRPGHLTYEHVDKYVDDIVTVGEDEIANAVLLLLEIEKVLVEGAGAVPLAALLSHKADFHGKRVLSILSGGNIDVNILGRIITRGLAVDGRIARLHLRLLDRPGTLMAALNTAKELQANVLDITHHRFDSTAPFGYVDVSVTLETRGHDHIRSICGALKEQGYLS